MSQQINLFDPVFLKQKKYFSAVAMLQALVLVVAGMLVLYAFELRQTREFEKLRADTERQAAERRDQLTRFAKEFSVQGTSKELEAEVVRLEAQLRKRAELFNELKTGVSANVEGFSPYLTALARQTTSGVWLTGVSIRGKSNDLVIKGRVLSADLLAGYVRSLNREPALAGRAVAGLQMTAKDAGPATAGAGAAAGAPGQAAKPPARFVEFTLSIPLGEPAQQSAERAAPPPVRKGAS